MTLTYYLVLAAILFTIGAVGVLVRRNAIVVFMCVELMLNSVNLTLVTFARATGTVDGQIMAFFVMVVAAAEVVVGLAIIMSIYRTAQVRLGRRRQPAEVLTGTGEWKHCPPRACSPASWLLIALPLAGAAVLLLGGRRTDRWGHLLGTATVVVVLRARPALHVPAGRARGAVGRGRPVHLHLHR